MALGREIRVLEIVDSANLSFADENRVGSSPSSGKLYFLYKIC